MFVAIHYYRFSSMSSSGGNKAKAVRFIDGTSNSYHARSNTYAVHSGSHTAMNHQQMPLQQRLPIPSGSFLLSLLSTVSLRMHCVDRRHSLASDPVVIVRVVGSFRIAYTAIVVFVKSRHRNEFTSRAFQCRDSSPVMASSSSCRLRCRYINPAERNGIAHHC